MKTLVAFLVCTTMLQGVYAAIQAKYSCHNPSLDVDGDEFVVFWLEHEEGSTYSRVFLDNRHHSECFASSPDHLQLQIDVGVSGQTETGQGCQAEMSETNNLHVRVIATKLRDQVQPDDLVFTASCDFNKNSTQEFVSEYRTVGGMLDKLSAMNLPEDVELELTDMYGNKMNQCSIGQDVRLRVTLKKSITAQQVRAISCSAHDTSEGSFELFPESCSIQDVPLEMNLKAKSTYEYQVSDLHNSDTFYTSSTPPFQCLGFNTDSAFITYMCNIAFCKDDDEVKCKEATCGHTREKRQTNSNTNTGTTIEVLSKRQLENRRKAKAFTVNRNGKTCDGKQPESLMLIVFGVLSALFLVNLIIAILICCCCVANNNCCRERTTAPPPSEASHQSRRPIKQQYDNYLRNPYTPPPHNGVELRPSQRY